MNADELAIARRLGMVEAFRDDAAADGRHPLAKGDRLYVFPSMAKAGEVFEFEPDADFDAFMRQLATAFYESAVIPGTGPGGARIFATVTRVRGGAGAPIIVQVRPVARRWT